MKSRNRKKCGFILLLLTFGTGTYVLHAQSVPRKTAEQYIEEFRFIAMQEMQMYKIPASITLGQGLLESSCGNSRLAAECNNHFGIKCRKEWQGATCIEDDDAANECFRAYRNAMESYRDHSLFLKGSPRYQSLFALNILNYKEWAHGLKAAGYATNPQYAVILNGIIARYRLGQYDTMVIMGEDYFRNSEQKPFVENGIPAVLAKAGSSPDEIAREHQLGTWQVYRYNDLERGDSLRAGEVVYLKPKKRKAAVPEHIFREGENLRDISQKYGIKLKRVYQLNNLEPGQNVQEGTVLQLQTRSKTNAPLVEPAPRQVPLKEAPLHTNDTMGGLYTVKAGETLYGLAGRWGMTAGQLATLNGFAVTTTLKAGQLLVLRGDLKPRKTAAEQASSLAPDTANGIHVVMPGETFYSISRMYGVTVDSLLSWNGLSKGEVLHSGREIKVVAPAECPSEKVQYYLVQPGDTAYSIARKFGISLEELSAKNQGRDLRLQPGMKLRVR